MARDEKTAGTSTGGRRLGRRRVAEPVKPGRGTRPSAPPAPKRKRGAVARERVTQLRAAFTMTRKADPRLVPLLAIAFLVPFVVLLLLGILIGHPVVFGVLGVLVALFAMTAVFGRRAQRNAFSQVEGQLGAAAAVLQNMRGDWRVTPAVGFTREQDMVHRVLGLPGIVLVGEGAPSRTRGLVITEKKKLSRFIGDTPVYDVLVGDGEGQVTLRGLEKHFVKLPRNVKPKDVNILDRKLKAMASSLPIPKGPMPTPGKMPRGKVR